MSDVPAFVSVGDLARIFRKTRECIYARVKRGSMPAYDCAADRTRGWSRSTLKTTQPALFSIVQDYFADQAHR